MKRVFALLAAAIIIGACGGGGQPYVPNGPGGAGAFSLTGGGTQSVLPGGTANYTFTVTKADETGQAADVTLSASGLPTGATPTFVPNPVLPVVGGSQVGLEVATTTGVAVGSYPFTVTGNDGATTRTASATLVVQGVVAASVEALDNWLTDEPGYPYGDDTSANYKISVDAPAGYAGDVRLEWRFIDAPAPTGDDLLATWYYGQNAHEGSYTYTVGPGNLRDSAECTFTRKRDIPITGTYRIEFKVVPLVAGYTSTPVTEQLEVRDNYTGGARIRGR